MADEARWSDALLVSLVSGGGTAVERVFRARAAELMLSSDELRSGGLVADAIMLLVGQVAGLLPRSKVWALLEATAMLECADDRYRLRDVVSIGDFDHSDGTRLPRSLAKLQWSRDDLVSVFLPSPPDVAWTVRNVRDAVHSGYRWILWTLRADEHGRPLHCVLPAFWNCDDDADTPLGTLPAVTSVGDSLAALCDGATRDVGLRDLPGDHGPAIRNAVLQLLAYAVEAAGPDGWDEPTRSWNAGGFLPHDDQPEAVYATVDATWDAVNSLASVLARYDELDAVYGGLSELRSTVEQSVLAGVQFLLRMQLDDGGWGIYRYPGDEVAVPAFEFTTGQTVLALSLAVQSGVLESATSDVGTGVETSMRRSWSFLQRASTRIDELTVWAPYFRDDTHMISTADIVSSSCWTGSGLLALFRTFDDLRAEIAPFLRDIVALADRHWQPEYARWADASFRVPLADGLNDTFGKWSNRYDVTVVVTLLSIFSESCRHSVLGVSFSPDLWQRIEHTIGDILTEQHPVHGHWGEPVRGLPSASAAALALTALQLYLAASITLASGRDVAAPQG